MISDEAKKRLKSLGWPFDVPEVVEIKGAPTVTFLPRKAEKRERIVTVPVGECEYTLEQCLLRDWYYSRDVVDNVSYDGETNKLIVRWHTAVYIVSIWREG